MDPELKKLLEKLEPEDLRDLAALHGAGSLERQAKAHVKNTLAENGILILILVTVGGVVMLVGMYIFLIFLMVAAGH